LDQESLKIPEKKRINKVQAVDCARKYSTHIKLRSRIMLKDRCYECKMIEVHRVSPPPIFLLITGDHCKVTLTAFMDSICRSLCNEEDWLE
jgi:hypothetical protein